MIARDPDLASIDARLTEAAANDETLEVILVLRGRVRRLPGTHRWRIRSGGQRVLTFSAESVIAATPVTASGRTPRRS